MMKYAGTELNKRRNALVMAAGGSDALAWDGGEGKRARDWLRSKGNSIEGGTSEIQLGIVAKHILGLPGHDEPADRRPEDAAGDGGGVPCRGRRDRRELRHWRDTGCSDGFGTRLWKRFAELGLTGICIPESARRPGPRRDRGGAGARGDRAQFDPLAVPDHRRCGGAGNRGYGAWRALVSGHPVGRGGAGAGGRRRSAPRARITALEAEAPGQRFRSRRDRAVRCARQFGRHDPHAARTGGAPGDARPDPVRGAQGRGRSGARPCSTARRPRG